MDLDDVSLSIVIPFRGSVPLLERALSSLATERLPGMRIVVVEDGPAERRPAGPWPVEWVRLPERSGPCEARNVGLQHGEGEFVYFFDADDLAVPGALTEAVSYLVRHPHAPAVCGGIAGYVDAEDNPLRTAEQEPAFLAPDVKALDLDFFRSGRRISPQMSRFVFRREALLAVGGFDRSLDEAEDWDLLLRFLKKFSIPVIELPLFWYRFHGTNKTLRSVSGSFYVSSVSQATARLVRMSHGLSF